jgi:acetoin utilization protein AcuB
MTASDLIAHDIPALKIAQTGRDAYHLLSDHHVKHLPVVDGNRLAGIISEEDIFNHRLYDSVETYDFSMLRTYFVRPNEHLFEIMRIMGENRLTVIPVVDTDGNYLGMVSQNTMLRALSTTTAFAMPGGILVLEIHRKDYSLLTIARCVEEESARILTSVVTSSPDSEMLEVTLKINREDLSRIASGLERYGFTIKHSYADDHYSEGIRERYESLMRYLDF